MTIVESIKSWLCKRWPAYEPMRHIEGTYGLVFVVEAKESNVSPQRFCVKTLNPEKLKPGVHDLRRLFEREMRLWLNIPTHYHVLPALGLEFAPPPPNLASEFDVLPLVRMPFCDATLSVCVKDKIAMSPVDRLITLAQVCSGLQWLYKHGLQGHGDLKPDNILLSDLRPRFALPDGEGLPSKAHYWQARVADLGWADIWTQGGGSYHAWRPYLAPERFRNTVVPEASDIFAVGVIACELLSGKHPAGDVTEVLAKKWGVKKWEAWATSGPRNLEVRPLSLRDLFDRALAPDPSARPSASDLQSALCDILQQEHGLNLAPQLSVQDDQASEWDTTSHGSWAAVEMARVGAPQLDASIAELEARLAEFATGVDDRSAARWLVAARTLQQLLRLRRFPTDAARVAALAREALDLLLRADRSTTWLGAEVYGVGSDTLDIAPEEVVFEFAHEALTNLRETMAAGMGEQALLEPYRAPMNNLVSVVYNKLCKYWSQEGIELDERAVEVLRQDGSLGAWWSEYWSRRGWHS